MPAECESSMTPRTTKFHSVMEEKTGTHFLPPRKAFRPCAPWLIGLAFVVAPWGLGYKLSQYYPRLDAATRASFAKLWDEHQDSAHSATIPRTIAQSHRSRIWTRFSWFFKAFRVLVVRRITAPMNGSAFLYHSTPLLFFDHLPPSTPDLSQLHRRILGHNCPCMHRRHRFQPFSLKEKPMDPHRAAPSMSGWPLSNPASIGPSALKCIIPKRRSLLSLLVLPSVVARNCRGSSLG